MTIEKEILKHLLENNGLTTGELSDLCGYSNKSNKYGNVDKPLKKLVNAGFLIREKISHEKGRRPSRYRIKEELPVILDIYHEFEDLQDVIRNQEWILDLILNNKLNVENNALKGEIRQMLKLSPTFIYLALVHPSINELADYWFTIITQNKLNKNIQVLQDREGFLINSPYKFHEFFTFCVYNDALNSDDLNNENTEKSLNFLNEIIKKSRASDSSIENFSMSVVMRVVKSMCELFQNNDTNTTRWLISQNTLYDVKKQAWEELIKENQEDINTYYEMVTIYNEIFNKLNLGKGD